MNALGIDYGSTRIGVAACDDGLHLPYPVETVSAQPWEQSTARLAEIVRQKNATTIVMGLPIRQDGTEGNAAATVRKFAEQLSAKLSPGVTLAWQDEYGSTTEAKQRLREAGKKEINHRPLIDQAAAVVILEDFLRVQGLI